MVQPTSNAHQQHDLEAHRPQSVVSVWGRTWRDISNLEDRTCGLGCFSLGAIVAFMVSGIYLWSLGNQCLSEHELKWISIGLLALGSIPVLTCIAIGTKNLCRSSDYERIP